MSREEIRDIRVRAITHVITRSAIFGSYLDAPRLLLPLTTTTYLVVLCTMPPPILNDSEDDEDVVVYDDSVQSSSHASGEAAPAITLDGTRDTLNQSTGSTGRFVKLGRRPYVYWLTRLQNA